MLSNLNQNVLERKITKKQYNNQLIAPDKDGPFVIAITRNINHKKEIPICITAVTKDDYTNTQ